MIAILLLIWVVRTFVKQAEKQGLNKVLWGFIAVLSYYGPVLLFGLVIYPELVMSGVIPVTTESEYVTVGVILQILCGVICCIIAFQILKKKGIKDEKDSINRIENYMSNKQSDE